MTLNVSAQDLSAFQQICAEIGFKKKTVAFGECVLELHRRERDAGAKAPSKAVPERPRSLSQEETQCESYGFQYGTTRLHSVASVLRLLDKSCVRSSKSLNSGSGSMKQRKSVSKPS